MSGDTPKVWVRFERKTSDGRTLKLRIQDVPAEKIDEAIEFLMKHYTPDDPLSVAYKKKFAAGYDKEAEESESEAWVAILKRSHIVICCSDEQPHVTGDIIAVAATLLLKRGEYDVSDYETKLKSEVAQRLLTFALEIHSKYNPFEVFPNVNVYLDDMGLVVHPQYKDLGIFDELLKTRRLQLKAFGAEVTGGWMKTKEAQQAAEKDGWSTTLEIAYADLAKDYQLSFDKDLPKVIKIMTTNAS